MNSLKDTHKRCPLFLYILYAEIYKYKIGEIAIFEKNRGVWYNNSITLCYVKKSL